MSSFGTCPILEARHLSWHGYGRVVSYHADHQPLEEKMVLFWHQVFATGQSKIDHWHELISQVDMFREKGMGSYRDLLVALAQDPAMIYWLDNCDNHAHAVNENWGRSWSCSAWV